MEDGCDCGTIEGSCDDEDGCGGNDDVTVPDDVSSSSFLLLVCG
jgi:hypothetical protein